MIWSLTGGRQLDLRQHTRIMGILNVTPDSFYDGGRHDNPGRAVTRALEMVEEGADIIDVGGESSRPPVYGEAVELTVAEEIERIVPVIAAIRQQSDVPISVDTTTAEVAQRAIDSGADIINDISALDDDGMAGVAASSSAPVVLMHRRGTPATMQRDTHYDDLLGEVRDFLDERCRVALSAGIAWNHVAVDPGIGFGKSAGANFALLRYLSFFARPGQPLLIGASRKSFLWKSVGLSPDDALEGSLAAAAVATVNGANVIRTHDVLATTRVVRVAESICSAPVGSGGSSRPSVAARDVERR